MNRTKTARSGLILAMLLTASAGATGEGRTQRGHPGGTPGFTGTWMVDAGPGGGSGRGGSGSFKVTETADELQIERQGRNGAIVTTYKLDGSETELPAGRNGGSVKASAKREGDKLVITTRTEAGESFQTWTITDGTLTIERQGPQGPVVTKYKRTQ